MRGRLCRCSAGLTPWTEQRYRKSFSPLFWIIGWGEGTTCGSCLVCSTSSGSPRWSRSVELSRAPCWSWFCLSDSELECRTTGRGKCQKLCRMSWWRRNPASLSWTWSLLLDWWWGWGCRGQLGSQFRRWRWWSISWLFWGPCWRRAPEG